jgi:hypothetical protein
MVRTFLKTSLLALLIATVGAVSAQDSMSCLNLSADDCTYINTATANTATALGSAFTQSFTIDGTVSGIPDQADATFHAEGTGPIVENTASTDVPVNFSSTFTASFSGNGQSGDVTTEVRLVDGVFYYQDPSDQSWKGIKVQDVMAQASSNPMMPNASTFDPSTLGLDETDMTALMELPKAEGFLDYSRDGETFTFIADLGALLKSSEWTTFTTQVMPKLQKNPDMAQASMVLSALPMLLSSGTIKVVEVVDPSVNAVTELSFLIDGEVNAGMMSGDATAKPVVLSFAFNLKLSDLGGSFTVEAPADAEIQEMPSTSN